MGVQRHGQKKRFSKPWLCKLMNVLQADMDMATKGKEEEKASWKRRYSLARAHSATAAAPDTAAEAVASSLHKHHFFFKHRQHVTLQGLRNQLMRSMMSTLDASPQQIGPSTGAPARQHSLPRRPAINESTHTPPLAPGSPPALSPVLTLQGRKGSAPALGGCHRQRVHVPASR